MLNCVQASYRNFFNNNFAFESAQWDVWVRMIISDIFQLGQMVSSVSCDAVCLITGKHKCLINDY